MPKCLKHDISLPINNIEKFHQETQKMISKKIKKTRTIFFGHLGDGNLHYNVFGNGKGDDGFENQSQNITENLYKIIEKLNGSFLPNMALGN